ncbi:hypothetical protein D3C72_1700450 [compost metagenome]
MANGQDRSAAIEIRLCMLIPLKMALAPAGSTGAGAAMSWCSDGALFAQSDAPILPEQMARTMCAIEQCRGHGGHAQDAAGWAGLVSAYGTRPQRRCSAR